MDIKNVPLIISRESLLHKVWKKEDQEKIELAIKNSLDKEEEKELKNLLPTSEELNWMKFYTSNSPELMRHIKKMSVCFDVEVKKATAKSILFIYGEFEIEILSPNNIYDIFLALDESEIEGFKAFVESGNVKIGKEVLKLDKIVDIDLLMTVKKVISKFFFLI